MTIQIVIGTDPTPSQLGSISGTVTSSGNPLKEAIVTATMQSNPSVTGQAATDANGLYAITDLPPGTYDVEATASSYQPLVSNGLVVAAGADTPADFSLTLLPCPERPVKDFTGVSFIDELLGRREGGGTTTTTGYVTESMQYIKSNGFNAIRVPFYWESYVYNSPEFMDRIEFIAQTAQEKGICVFFDNHHYYTTSYWGLDIEGKPPGRGFPSFVVQDFPPINNDYILTAGPFWDAFLSNNIVINGNNVWDVQADFFKTIINRVNHYDNVAGYEILNEPHFFDPTHYDKVGDYNTYMAGEIREVTSKKIFFDRENTWGFSRDPDLEPKVVPRGVTGIVYSPHLYAIPYPGSQAEQQIQNFKTWSQLWNSEVLIGETVADTQADADQLLTVLKGNGFGWTVWSWKPTVSTGLGRTYY
ncbi:MAG: cellulase family glycosylhydrolase, partial [Nitrososphaera sp.]